MRVTPDFTPTRKDGREYLDDPRVPDSIVRRSLRDVATANALFGGTRAVLAELRPLLGSRRGKRLTLLDVGTGAADIPAAARREGARFGVDLAAFGADAVECLARTAGPRLDGAVCADALALPFANRSVDVVVCSQLLHHFTEPKLGALLREANRVARELVIVSDLRRSWVAAGGIWLASFPLRFHPVSRHDGMQSVLRGFTPDELRDHVRRATSLTPVVRRRAGWRVTASWSPLP